MEHPFDWSTLPDATLGPDSFSIIIPTYNRADFLSEAVEGALAQSHRPIEVVVVDDGSTDRSPEILRRYSGRIRHFYQQNRGLGAARNLGIRHSRGDFFAFLDSDDVCLPDWIERVRDTFRRHPEAGTVSSAEYEIDENGNRGRVHTKRTPGLWFTPQGLIARDTGVGSGRPPVVRRSCIRRFGGFDEAIHCAVDSEMWIRYAFRVKMMLQPEPVILRRCHAGTLSSNTRQDAGDWIRILHRLAAEQPEFVASNRSLYRRTLAKNYVRAGREALAGSEGRIELVAEARRALVSAIKLAPLHRRAWTYLFASWVAPETYGRIWRWERNRKAERFRRRVVPCGERRRGGA